MYFMQYWNLVQFQLWRFCVWKLSVKMERATRSQSVVSINAELGDLFTKFTLGIIFLSRYLLVMTRNRQQNWRGEIKIFDSFLKLFGLVWVNKQQRRPGKIFGKGVTSKIFCIMEENCYHKNLGTPLKEYVVLLPHIQYCHFTGCSIHSTCTYMHMSCHVCTCMYTTHMWMCEHEYLCTYTYISKSLTNI